MGLQKNFYVKCKAGEVAALFSTKVQFFVFFELAVIQIIVFLTSHLGRSGCPLFIDINSIPLNHFFLFWAKCLSNDDFDACENVRYGLWPSLEGVRETNSFFYLGSFHSSSVVDVQVVVGSRAVENIHLGNMFENGKQLNHLSSQILMFFCFF